VCDSTSQHRRHEACIVCRFALDIVLNDKAIPFVEDASLATKERKGFLDVVDLMLRLRARHPQAAVLGNRPSRHDPEFVEDLRNDAGIVIASKNGFNSGSRSLVVVMGRLSEASDEVGIDKNPHSPRPS
jgi:hypothetical protein